MLNDAPAPQMWEYTIVHTDHLNGPSGPQLAPIWRRKYGDGSTDWDQINKLGEAGWEMVNAFPVEGAGTLQYLAFVFKRPKLHRSSPSAAEPATDAIDAPAAPPLPASDSDQTAPTAPASSADA